MGVILPLALGAGLMLLLRGRAHAAAPVQHAPAAKPSHAAAVRRPASEPQAHATVRKLPTSTSSAPAGASARVEAAREFVSYVQAGGREHAQVARYQDAMGGVRADGIIGPKTRKRAEDLLNMSVAWPAGVAPSTPDPIVDLLGSHTSQPAGHAMTNVRAASPNPPAPSSMDSQESAAPAGNLANLKGLALKRAPARKPRSKRAVETPQHKAARGLVAYVKGGGRARNDVAVFQRGMGQLDPDGVVGSQTKARAAQLLGARQSWPANLDPKGALSGPAEPAQAARELRDYLDVYGGVRKDRIATYQSAMGGLRADGIAGPKTRARIAQLLGE